MDPTLILIAVALAAFIFFQFRSSKKRQKEAAERLATLLPGVEVMTNFGLYGTLVSMDEEENIATLEIAPGVLVKMHRQVVLKAVDAPVEETLEEKPADDEAAGPELNESHAVVEDEPQFGQRTSDTKKSRGKRGESTD